MRGSASVDVPFCLKAPASRYVRGGETVQTLNTFSYSPFRPALTFLEQSENKQMFSESQGDLETIN